MKEPAMPEQLRQKMHQEYFQKLAQDMADTAEHHGFVVTIEQEPLQPLAMGNYRNRVTVRPARKKE